MVAVTELKVQRSSRLLYAATHGRSVFRVSLENPQPEPVLITPVGGESISTPSELLVRWAGLQEPVDVQISYDGGSNFQTVGQGVSGGEFTIHLPRRITDEAQVRVFSPADNRELVSGHFTLRAEPNATKLGARGIVATAITVRDNRLWAARRGSDTLMSLLLPNLLGQVSIPTTGILGEIRDLTYDAATQTFYVLTGNADFTGPRIFAMDTTGTVTRELDLSGVQADTIIGIAMSDQGLTLATSGSAMRLITVNPSDMSIVSMRGPLVASEDADRRGLAYEGTSFIQAVITGRPADAFPNELQRLNAGNPPNINDRAEIVLSSSELLDIVGLVENLADSTIYATDTSGAFYRFNYVDMFGTEQVGAVRTVTTGATGLSIVAVTPNPVRESATISYRLESADRVTISLYAPDGRLVGSYAEGQQPAGNHARHIDGLHLPSGVYFVAITTGSGGRVARGFAIAR